MIYKVYSIQDTLLGFNAPFIMPNEAIAKRSYVLEAKKNENSLDLRLYEIGEFNDETGEITPKVPTQIMGGLEHE